MPLLLCLVKIPTTLSGFTLFISMSLISTSVKLMSDSIPCGAGPASSSSPSLSHVPLSSSSSRSMGDWQGEVPSEAAGDLVPTLLWGVFGMGNGCELSLTCSAGVAFSTGQKIKIHGLERFSNNCRKNNTKVITATNHNRRKQRDEPTKIPYNYL